MDLPIQFPSDADIIAEEAARFRELPAAERMQVIRGLLSAGALMMRQSPRAAYLQKYVDEQEERAQQAIKEFISRHGG